MKDDSFSIPWFSDYLKSWRLPRINQIERTSED